MSEDRSKPRSGGPVFPEPFIFDESRGECGRYVSASDIGCGGMTIRQFYAAAALQGVIASRLPLSGHTESNPQMYAAAAFSIADAMLEHEAKDS